MLTRPRAPQTGFTLVEVMVTVFVAAIGLLAAAALQATSKKAAIDAMQRTTASVLAQDMLERIRSNAGELTAYASNGAQIAAAPTATVSCGSGTNCTTLQLVDYDLKSWWTSLNGDSETIAAGANTTASAGGLRSPTGCIRYGSNRVVEVVVAWRGMSRITQESDGNPDDPTSDTCGEAQADYEKSGSQSFRRVLRLQAHVQSPAP